MYDGTFITDWFFFNDGRFYGNKLLWESLSVLRDMIQSKCNSKCKASSGTHKFLVLPSIKEGESFYRNFLIVSIMYNLLASLSWRASNFLLPLSSLVRESLPVWKQMGSDGLSNPLPEQSTTTNSLARFANVVLVVLCFVLVVVCFYCF